MAFIFPADKKDFVAPNGVTYTFDGAKWITKAFKTDDSVQKVSQGLIEEARIREDEDFKLLARINGLEIPTDIPENYDDSGLRELIEKEGALRASGDIALDEKSGVIQHQVEENRQSLEEEKAYRLEGDVKLDQALKAESDERKRVDSDLYAKIDGVETGRKTSAITVTPGEKAVWFEGDEPVADPKGRSGWFFETRDDPKSQAYYTLWSQESDAPVQVTLADIEALSIVLRNQGTVNPFIKIFTRRKNDRKDADIAYRSCVAYVSSENISGIPALTVLTTNTEQPLYNNLVQHGLQRQDSSIKGPLEDDEVINKIVVATSSGKGLGDTKMLLEKFILQTEERVDVVSLSIQTDPDGYDDSRLYEQLEIEKAARIDEDRKLDEGIKQNNNEIGQFREDLEGEKAARLAGDELVKDRVDQVENRVDSVEEKLEEEKKFRIEEDEKLAKSVVLLEAQDQAIKADLEREKGFRVEGDEELKKSLVLLEAQDQAIKADLEREKGFRVEGDEALKAATESLQRQVDDGRQSVDVEKAARIESDLKVSQGLIEEARIRADEDYKLLARINGLDIPEMPKDYDDSGLRELIENESALRATGDVGLNAKIDATSEKIDGVAEKVEEERVYRLEGDAKADQALKAEAEERKRVDSDLYGKIDELGVDDVKEHLEKLDTDVDVLNKKVDFNAEEAVTDRDRQDAALDEYKAEVTLQQEEQDQELVDYKAEVASQQEAQDDALAEHIALVATEQAAQDLALAEFKAEVGDGQTAQDEALDAFKSEYEQNKVDVAAEQQAQDLRLAALEAGSGGDPFDPDLLKGYVTQDQLDLSQEAQDDRIKALEDEDRFSDTELKDLITAEEAARTSADQALQDLISAEETARTDADQALQDQIDAIDTSGGGGVEYLGELKDVDLSGTRSSFATVENEFTWIHYRTSNPDVGEIGNEGDALLLHKQAWGPTDPTALIERLEPGSIMAFRGIAGGGSVGEEGVVVSITSKGDTWAISFKQPLVFLSRLIEMGFSQDGVNVAVGYAGKETVDPGPSPDPTPDPTPDPVPPGDTVTGGTFLGYDKDKALWVPQTLAVSDLSDYYTKDQTYTKTEVDEKIDAIDVDVNLDGYYTKAEVDASQKAQDDRIDALAAGGGGGSADLANYYTKDETYNKDEVDRPLQAEIQARMSGDAGLQDQINDLKGSTPDYSGLEDKVNTNTLGIAKNVKDISDLNVDQGRQDKAIGDLETAVGTGLGNRYTKDEVDAKFDALEDADLSGFMVTDGRNKVSESWRLVNEENTTTYISTHEGELGLYNVKYPEKGVHGANMQYVDDQDAVTLQAAKDYADAIDVPEVSLDEYYTKDEVDASQREQDDNIEEIAAAATSQQEQIEENASGIAVLEATNVHHLNDLDDVQLVTRSFRDRKANRDRDGGTEELHHSNAWHAWRNSVDNVAHDQWTLQNNVLTMADTNDNPVEWDDFVAKLLADNKLHIVIKYSAFRTCTARYVIKTATVVGARISIEFTETPTVLNNFVAPFRDSEAVQLLVSYSEIVTEPPVEPEPPTKRSDIVLGYDKGTKLWTPHLADYLPSGGGVLTNTVSMRKGDKDYNQFTIAPNSGEDYATNIYSRNGGQMRFRTTPDKNGDTNKVTHLIFDGKTGETKIYQLVDPSREDHAVNRRYFEKWVNAPARMSWLWQGSKDSSADPGSRNFYYHPGGNNGIQGYMRFSFMTYNGTNIGDGKFGDTNVQIDNGPVGCIWQYRSDVEKWKLIMQFRIKSWRWNFNNHFEFGLSSTNGRNFSDLGSNVEYWITVGGFF